MTEAGVFISLKGEQTLQTLSCLSSMVSLPLYSKRNMPLFTTSLSLAYLTSSLTAFPLFLSLYLTARSGISS